MSVSTIQNAFAWLISRTLMQYYTSTLTDSIELIHYFPDYSGQELERALSILSRFIRSVVAYYFGDKEDLQINANVMVASPVFSQRMTDYPGLIFADPDKDLTTYRHILRVIQWAHGSHCAPHDFALPVASNRVQALFGAPRAFITGDIQVIGNIKDESELTKLLNGQPPQIATEVREYFKHRSSFCSFASWRILYREEPMGVLNVQSNQVNIFGDDNEHGDDIIGYIKPFCAILGLLMKEITLKNMNALDVSVPKG